MHKTAFVTPDGQYEFMGMLFGMVNSEATCTLVGGLRKVLEGQSGVSSYIDIHSYIVTAGRMISER